MTDCHCGICSAAAYIYISETIRAYYTRIARYSACFLATCSATVSPNTVLKNFPHPQYLDARYIAWHLLYPYIPVRYRTCDHYAVWVGPRCNYEFIGLFISILPISTLATLNQLRQVYELSRSYKTRLVNGHVPSRTAEMLIV